MSDLKDNYYIVIPVYNEGAMISCLIEDVIKHTTNIIVVDDGSRDDTVQKVLKYPVKLIQHETNKGKGAALMTGINAALEYEKCDFVITMDGDGQHSPKSIDDFIILYEKEHPDAIIGNRLWNSGDMPFIRKLTNKFMSWLLCRRAGITVKDTQNGYRLYSRDIVKCFPKNISHFSAESEVLICMGMQNSKILNLDIDVIYGKEVSSISPITDTLRFFNMLRKYKEV
ncbi:MAG: glycosyltransferase family 2 protein [Kiritimatiellae bacterium]|jgi:glycosyltransferase involved in cell wall biosynthesis|nr:glycosyltransferase family 2 protein [Kiritimatiellia bacterium]